MYLAFASETLYLLIKNSHIPFQAPGNHISTLHLHEFDYIRHLE